MQWLRVDRYFTGDVDNPHSFFQPVPCMHCEKAPCEMGCPVHATVHSPEGLNQMVYNRCIGTRTCSSYCPYKVRRFNWFDYRAPPDSPTHAAQNPDVTVRSRGVMEKCTYCTQRIEGARAHGRQGEQADPQRRGRHRLPGRPVRPPRSCSAISTIRSSEVAKRRKSGRHYVLLEELGTRPRTTYLARWKDEDGVMAMRRRSRASDPAAESEPRRRHRPDRAHSAAFPDAPALADRAWAVRRCCCCCFSSR